MTLKQKTWGGLIIGGLILGVVIVKSIKAMAITGLLLLLVIGGVLGGGYLITKARR